MDYLIDLKKQNLSGKVALEGGISLGVDTDGNIKKIDESGAISDIVGSVDESRLLPENPANGDIPCFDATATVGGGNDANTKLLLQPATSDGLIVDQAAGNTAPVTLENHNVTVDEEGNMVFDGSNAYLKIPANTLPSDFFNGTDEWTLDIVYNVASKSMQCLFGCSSSLRMDFLLDSNGSLQIGGGPNLGTGWPFNENVHLTFEIYKDGASWKYTIFRNGSVVTTGTWVNADWRSVAQYVGWEGESDSRKINGKIKALRLTSGALHKGAAFQSDYPWTRPQTVGEWGKFNKSELVKSVNGQLPDESGNVTVETGGVVDESRLLPDAGPDDSWMHHSESMDLVTPTDMTSMQSADWTLTAENVQENFSGKPWGLFDSGSYGFYIDGSGPATCTWTRRDGTPTLIDRLKIYTGSPSNNNGDSYEFYGSQDGNNWTLLGSWSAEWNSDSVKDTETNLNVLTLEVLSNSTKYLHYKFSANSPILECLKGYGVTAKNEWKKLPTATASAAGLMAAADKTAIAGLTTRGIYPNAATRSGAVDFNDVIDHGMYLIGGDAPHLNYPETYQQNGGFSQVLRNGNYLVQTFTPLNTNKVFIRSGLKALSDLSERTFSAWRRLLTDTEITESKARPGYFKLPGGTIVQWGVALNITADGTTSVTLPIAFPNSAFVATATATGSGLIASTALDGNSKLNVIVKGYPGSGSFTVYWIAIGY